MDKQRGIAERIANLSPEKQRVLQRLLKSEDAASPLSRTTSDGPRPLSFAQQRLWFLEQLDPASGAYNLPIALRLHGALNVPALERSLNEIVRRHEVLRTTFPVVEGQTVQAIAPELVLAIPLEDLTAIEPSDRREAEARRIARADALQPFDLACGPLVQAKLLRLGPDHHVMLLTLHHIVTDGWSMGVLTRELSATYAAFAENRPSPLAALPIQYADFAVWQREWLTGAVLEKQLGYWRRQLAGAARLDLPTDHPRPAVQTFRGQTVSLELGAELTAAVKRLSQKLRITPFRVLLAAFNALLHRYTGQTDIVVGSPVANRTRSAVQGLIGFFVNTLALRTSVDGSQTFLQAVARASAVAHDAFAHQDLPFERLVEELQPDRDLGQNPIFQVMFEVQPPGNEEFRVPGLRLQGFGGDLHTARFDLELYVWEQRQGLVARLVYSTDLFEAATAQRIVGHYRTLLAGAVASPDTPIGALPLLGDEEREQLLVTFNATHTPYPSDSTPRIFEQRAAERPDAIALRCGGERVTYRELNARANQLARRLRRAGVRPDNLVAVCLDRSADLIVTLVAILKAGGAYVPLPAGYPAERLAFMLSDTAATVLVTARALRPRLPSSGAHVICLDDERAAIAAESTEDLDTLTGLDHLAYVTYTSGSTGLPKGVAVPHRGIVRLLFGTDYARFGPEERLLQVAPVAFDASTLEIWGALMHGGCCVIYPPHLPTAAELGQVLHDHRVTTLWLTASLFNAVIDEAPEALRGVRQLLIGGEALSVVHVRRALSLLPDTTIINGYGPTESTTFTCCDTISRDLGERAPSVPIGPPIGNTTVYVLDDLLQPQPVGVAGELYIGGDGLARGYHGRSALTAEKFLPDPFARAAGARMYRTGDLVRWRFDGRIEFLGRLDDDDQVKIRGFRVEPGEIEVVLKQHAMVRDAVVTAREDEPGQKRLVAYVVTQPVDRARADAPALEADHVAELVPGLGAFLAGRLPHYMLPSAFVVLEQIPLRPNGKVDRRALPPPETAVQSDQLSFVAPRNELEEAIAQIWRALLSVDRVGIHDNFFELGGHSLMAMRVVSRLRDTFQIDVSMRALFEHPTVAGLGEVLLESHLEHDAQS